MAGSRKFYRTLLTVEILSDEPRTDLDELADIIDGCYRDVASVLINTEAENTVVGIREARRILKVHEREGEFDT